MTISVRVPMGLRSLTGGLADVSGSGDTLAALIDSLEREYPGMKSRLLGEDGSMAKVVNVYVNDDDIRFLSGLDTPLADGDQVTILPTVAGGRAAHIPGGEPCH